MEKATVYAKYNNAKISPKKAGAAADLVRGKSVKNAIMLLALDTTKGAAMILKTLKSAEANARNNNNLRSDDLVVADVRVDGARVLKRGMFGAKGRYKPLVKRYSHITVGLASVKEDKENK